MHDILIYLASIGFILIIAAFFLKPNHKSNNDCSTDHIKMSYGLFITNLQEFDEYFTAYEFGKFLKVKENELTESEYKILSQKYIQEFFKQHPIDSKMIINVIHEMYGNSESLVIYLKRRFDMILLKHYPSLGLDKTKIDFHS